MTTTQDKPALAYIHIFADGSKYFGNAVSPNRPWDFTKRNNKWLEAYSRFGAPIVQVRRNLTIEEADRLELWGFDRYVSQGGVKLQSRPSGSGLSTILLMRSKADTTKPHSIDTILKRAKSNTGKRRSETSLVNMRVAQKGNRNFGDSYLRSNRKVISMLDGRVTTAAQSGHYNKKNPNYIGTWVDL